MKPFKNIFYCLLLVSCCGCSQYKTAPIMQNPEITEKNIVNKLASNIKHYDYEPMYYLKYVQNVCYSEILINDILVNQNFQEIVDGATVPINNFIFKNGIQKVTLRLFPVGKNKGFDFPTLVDDTDMKIEISESDNKERNVDGKIIKKYVTPLVINKEYEEGKFEFAGKTYYEASFTFEAKIPYEVVGFENARDLREWDKEILHKKLLQEYNKIKEIYQKKDYDNIARTSYISLNNQFVSEYQTRDYINDVWTMLMDAYKLPTFEMQPIENYKMVFFADGKLVALMQNLKDSRVRGNTSLWAKFDRAEGIETLFCNSYFYIPKGETEFKVY